MRPTPGSGRDGRGCASMKEIPWAVVWEVCGASVRALVFCFLGGMGTDLWRDEVIRYVCVAT